MSRAIANCGFPILDYDLRSIKFVSSPQSAIRNSQSGGFTLLEVLLAMAILSVILTVVYASFSTAGRNIEQAETIRDETDIARTLIARLSIDIANAYLMSNVIEPSVPTRFYGKKEEREGVIGTGDRKIRHDSINLTTLTNWRKRDSKEMNSGKWAIFSGRNRTEKGMRSSGGKSGSSAKMSRYLKEASSMRSPIGWKAFK